MKTTQQLINKAKEEFENKIQALAEDFRNNVLLPFCKDNNLTWHYDKHSNYSFFYNANGDAVWFKDNAPKEYSEIKEILATEILDRCYFSSYIQNINRAFLERVST